MEGLRFFSPKPRSRDAESLGNVPEGNDPDNGGHQDEFGEIRRNDRQEGRKDAESDDPAGDSWRDVIGIIARCGLDWNSALNMTLRDLLDYHEQQDSARWDHTAFIASLIYNLTTVVNNIANKKKLHPKPFVKFHPYRMTSSTVGMIITPDNIDCLKSLAVKTKKIKPKRRRDGSPVKSQGDVV